MSLDVSDDLLEQAQRGEISDADLVDCIRTSLPYASDLIEGLVKEFRASDAPYVGNLVPPPDEQARGQLLRVLASDAMRGALQRHHGVTLAFQNCHKAAVFDAAPAPAAYADFTSARGQILNQTPELRDC